MRCAGLLLSLLACAGSTKATPADADAPVVEKREPPRAAVTEDCRRAYDGYIKAWGDWFDAELDSDAQAALIAEFGQELPRRAALEEMRETADELRYEPGFELWIRALTATEDAIESCGEGAPRPR